MVAVCSQHTFTHTGIAGKISNGNPLQAECPRGQQVKSAVPGKVVNAGGGFEENNGSARGSWRIASYELRDSRNFEIVESADKAAFDTLGEEFFEHRCNLCLFLMRDGAFPYFDLNNSFSVTIQCMGMS